MKNTRLSVFGLFLFIISWLLTDHYRPWTSFHSEALAIIALVFIIYGTSLPQSNIVVPRIIYWVVFAGILPWLQYVWGISLFAGDALLSSFYLLTLLIAIVTGYAATLADQQEAPCGWLALAHTIWFAALISAAVGLAQWLNLQDRLGTFAVQTEVSARAVGNLAQPNQLATLLLMGIVCLVYVFEKDAIGKLALTMAVAFLTGVLVLTQSRAGMVSLFVVAAYLIWGQRDSPKRLTKRAVQWWAFGFLVATFCFPSINKALLLGDARMLTATGSISERWLIWKQVVYAIGQAPWFGYGWNQTPTANAVGALAYPGSTTYTNAHNIILDLMVWTGIPIGMTLTGVISYWFIKRVLSVKRLESVMAMACLLPIGVHSLLEFPFSYSYFLIAAGFFVGIIESGYTQMKFIWFKVRYLWLLLMVWSVIGCNMVYEYFQIEEDFRIVRFENLRVGATPASYEVPQVWMLSHMAAMLQAARQVPKPDMPKADLENLRKVSDRFAYGAIRFKYAQALGLNSDPAGATTQLQIIHSMYGDFFYRACKDEIARLAEEQYPQLKSVRIP